MLVINVLLSRQTGESKSVYSFLSLSFINRTIDVSNTVIRAQIPE